MEKHMKKINPSGLCSVIQKFCVLLTFTAVCMAVISVRDYLHIRPADSYTDRGIHRFEPYEVLPVQVKIQPVPAGAAACGPQKRSTCSITAQPTEADTNGAGKSSPKLPVRR